MLWVGPGGGPAGRARPSGGGRRLCSLRAPSVLPALCSVPVPGLAALAGAEGAVRSRAVAPWLEGSAGAPLEPARGAALGPAGGGRAQGEARGSRGRTWNVGLPLPGLGPRSGPAVRGLVLWIWCLSVGECSCSAVSS